jgi:hypothetical protein
MRLPTHLNSSSCQTRSGIIIFGTVCQRSGVDHEKQGDTKRQMRVYSLVLLRQGRISSKPILGKILHYIVASTEARARLHKKVSRSEAVCEPIVALSSMLLAEVESGRAAQACRSPRVACRTPRVIRLGRRFGDGRRCRSPFCRAPLSPVEG